MHKLKKVLESSMKIRFHDCDPFNHLNNSRYIDYIVTARGDQLIESYGLDIYKMAAGEGLGWVSAQTQISYFDPALLMEEVVIQTQLIDATTKSLHLEAFMWNGDKTVVKALMWAKLVHFNLRSKRSEEHSEKLMQLFYAIVNPLPLPMDFESRARQVKTAKDLSLFNSGS